MPCLFTVKMPEYAFNKYGQEQLEGCFLGDFGNDDWYGGISHYLDACDEYLAKADAGHPVRANPGGGLTDGISVLSGGTGDLCDTETEAE